MKTHRTSRISALIVLLTIALLTFAVTNPVTSAAKCSPSKSKKTPAPATPSTPEATTPEEMPAKAESGGSSLPTLEAPATQPGSYEVPQTPKDISPAAQIPAEEFSGSSGQASSTPTPASTDGPSGPGKSAPSTSSKEHATFGDITSASGKCVVGDPNEYVTRKDIDWVWENTMKKYIPTFTNLIFDQLVTNNGSLSYCVRWENDKKLTKTVASKLQAMLEKQINLWNNWLVGYNCWPFDKIDITVVGFAVRDKSIMDWSDDSLGTIYEGILDAEGSPMCPDECYMHKGQATSADTSACKGKPFDISLWPSTQPGEEAVGTGGDWGQRVEINDMLNTMDDDQMMVLLHEMGHGFGLPEMYLAENKPSGFPACVMDEDSKLTHGDGWLLRSIFENIKSRYNF
jgi:hypothetical protein